MADTLLRLLAQNVFFQLLDGNKWNVELLLHLDAIVQSHHAVSYTHLDVYKRQVHEATQAGLG